jgi:hypothetical protein
MAEIGWHWQVLYPQIIVDQGHPRCLFCSSLQGTFDFQNFKTEEKKACKEGEKQLFSHRKTAAACPSARYYVL